MEKETIREANPILECCAGLLALSVPLRSGRAAAGVEPDFRDRIMGAFDVLERMAFEKQIPTTTVQHAKYAMAAFVDEAVLGSVWGGRLEWMSRPLQLEFFGEHLAGEGFFTRLAELRQGGIGCVDLLELYYACLQLGFEGMYKMRGYEQLMALQVDLRAQIENLRGVSDPRLSPAGVPVRGMLGKFGRHVPYWALFAVTAAGVFFGYGAYVGMSRGLTRREVAAIAADAHVLRSTGSAWRPAAAEGR